MPLRNRPMATATTITIVAAIGWLDYMTGRDIGFSLFYLAPIAASAWYVGKRIAIIVAVAAACAWLAADLVWSDSVLVTLWNAFTRLVIYVSQAWMVSTLHEDHIELRQIARTQAILARTDHATQLPNARAFLEAVEQVIDLGEALSLMYIDLDNFKAVNDRYGHAEGDEVLQRVAASITSLIRGGDLAARLGGDEFAVLLRGVSPEVAGRVAQRIIDHIGDIGADFPNSGLGATVGIAHYHVAPPNAAELLRSADAAMYEGKEAGKGAVVVRELGAESVA